MRVQSIKSCLITSATLSFISSLIITFASLTPGWRSINGQIRLQDRTSRSFSVSNGLFGFMCTQTDRTTKMEDLCLNWANNISLPERFVSILCVVSTLTALISVLWSLISLLDLFPNWENKPRGTLPILALIAFILATVAAVIYFLRGCSENDNFVAHLTSSSSSSSSNAMCSLHYSFFTLLVGCFTALLGFISALMVMLLKKRLVLGTNSYY